MRCRDGMSPHCVIAAHEGLSIGSALRIAAIEGSKSFRSRHIPPLPDRQVFEANVADPDPL